MFGARNGGCRESAADRWLLPLCEYETTRFRPNNNNMTVKFTLEQATNAQRWKRGITLLFL